jgi:hypothetical protein
VRRRAIKGVFDEWIETPRVCDRTMRDASVGESESQARTRKHAQKLGKGKDGSLSSTASLPGVMTG